MLTPQQVMDDVAARIRDADQESQAAAAAFHLGKWEEYWSAKREVFQKQIEAYRDAAIAAFQRASGTGPPPVGIAESTPDVPEADQ